MVNGNGSALKKECSLLFSSLFFFDQSISQLFHGIFDNILIVRFADCLDTFIDATASITGAAGIKSTIMLAPTT
jgi:hypothetical protein